MSAYVLIVEDDRDVVSLLKYNLQSEGYTVGTVSDGSLAMAEIRRRRPDLVILDLMLPGIGGLEICRLLRRSERDASIPVLMLTARGEESDRIVGLEVGADDYLTKPFSVRELVARVRALLRRTAPDRSSHVIQIENLVIDPQEHRVRIGENTVELTALEFRILFLLASHPGMVFSRDQLLDRAWGHDRSVTQRSVDVYVRRLREKMGAHAPENDYIQTVHGVGYRFKGR
jgi:phosphate regulon transcriptional regulator PhoB